MGDVVKQVNQINQVQQVVGPKVRKLPKVGPAPTPKATKAGMAMDVHSARGFLAHVADPKRAKRFGRQKPEEVLKEPIQKFKDAKPIMSHAGRQFIYRLPDERKILGEIDPKGWLQPKTFYSRSMPVDKSLRHVDITDVVGKVKQTQAQPASGVTLGDIIGPNIPVVRRRKKSSEDFAREMLKQAISPRVAGYLTQLIPGAVKRQLKP
nr:hypothetical protein [Anaerolineae bacterium]